MTEKAVETMLEKASELPEYSETTRPDTYFKSGFRLGYHQAEKDLALTWDDVSKIISIDQQVCGAMGISDYTHNHQQAMEEVLSRFNKLREK